jgi:hypothetical protein
MKFYRLIVCVLVLGLIVFSNNYLAPHVETKTASPPTIQSAAKTTSSLLIRPVFRISETATADPGRGATFPELAYNPDDHECLVVWESDGLTELKGVSDIYGQRLNAATNERIGISLRISTLTDQNKNHRAHRPKIVYSRTSHEYLVVWYGTGLYGAPDRFFEVYGQRLSRTGKIIGSNFRISHTADLGKVNTNIVRSSGPCDLAWNSTNDEYLVVWKGMGEPEDAVKMEIYGQRLKANGELLEKYVRISHTADQGSNFHANEPAIAYNSRDNQYLVVWNGTFKNESQAEIFGIGLSATGKVLAGTNAVRISQVTHIGANRVASSPRVVHNNANNEYFVVFQANALRGEGNEDAYEIFGQRIDAATLAEIGPNDARVSESVEPGNTASEPAVTFNSVAKEYLVIWRSSRQNATSEIYGQRISVTGTEIEADFQISTIAVVGKDRSVNNSSLTHNTANGGYLVVWEGNGLPGANTANITEIFGQQLAPARSPRL